MLPRAQVDQLIEESRQADEGPTQFVRRIERAVRNAQLSRAKLADRLRAQTNTLRTKSTPLADLIPLLQEAADALEEGNG